MLSVGQGGEGLNKAKNGVQLFALVRFAYTHGLPDLEHFATIIYKVYGLHKDLFFWPGPGAQHLAYPHRCAQGVVRHQRVFVRTSSTWELDLGDKFVRKSMTRKGTKIFLRVTGGRGGMRAVNNPP